MNADPTQMNADGMKMKRNSTTSSMETWAMAWSQDPHSPQLSAAWKRRLAALIDEFRAVFWNWS